MEVVWVRTPDCRECVREIKNTPRKDLDKIVQERKKSVHCRSCERLRRIEKEISDK